MATLVNWNAKGLPAALVNLPVIGSRLVLAYARATMVTADDSAGTFNVTFPQLASITGFWVTVLGAGNNIVGCGEAEGDVTGIDITIGTGANANRLTLADGTSGYDLTSGDIAHILVVGPSRV